VQLPLAAVVTLLTFDDYCKQETLQSRLSGVEYLVTGHYSKCGPNWCPKFPIFGKHEFNLVMNPKTGTEFVVYKVRKLQQ